MGTNHREHREELNTESTEILILTRIARQNALCPPMVFSVTSVVKKG